MCIYTHIHTHEGAIYLISSALILRSAPPALGALHRVYFYFYWIFSRLSAPQALGTIHRPQAAACYHARRTPSLVRRVASGRTFFGNFFFLDFSAALHHWCAVWHQVAVIICELSATSCDRRAKACRLETASLSASVAYVLKSTCCGCASLSASVAYVHK